MEVYTGSIARRYDGLSRRGCCLSCGGALSFAGVTRGDFCIDLGCGKGRDVIRMATLAGESGYACGVDISSGMIEIAREQALKLGIENIGFIKSCLERIALVDNCADLIISNCTINHSLNQGRVWKEISRLLKPGGRFVVSDIYAIENVPDKYRLDPEMIAECWAGAVRREVYLQNIADAGLESVEILEESLPYEKGKIKVASFTVKGFSK